MYPSIGLHLKIEHVESLFDNACMDLFHKICIVCMKFYQVLLDSVMTCVSVLMHRYYQVLGCLLLVN